MSPPVRKRTLSGGEQGKDVQAVQRAVYVAVGGKGHAHNARNGLYGDGTIQDIRTFQRSKGIEDSGSTGQPTLNALWPSFDAYGVSLYFRAKLAAPPDLPQDKLTYGMSGKRVRAVQQMLWRAFGQEAHNARNSTYGDGLAADVRHFHGVIDADPTDGHTITQSVWDMLWAFGDEYAHEIATDADTAGESSAARRSDLVTWAEWYVAQRGSTYSQARPYQRDDPPRTPLVNDCSGSASHLLKLAGFPDPSGNDYSGAGYTGTLRYAGSRVALPSSGRLLLAGDLVFYGGGRGNPQHVCLMLDAGRMFTFGSEPPTITTYDAYWTSGRRYDVGARRVLA